MRSTTVDATSTTSITSTTLPTTTTTTTTVPTTTTAPITTTASAVLAYCDDAGLLPTAAVLDSALTLDILGDGSADDVIEAWDVEGWSRLRLTTGGSVVSEVINPAHDGRYRPLGVAPVFPGDSAELFSVVGDGSAATEIGVFGIDAAECLFSYTYAGVCVPEWSLCFDGGIDLFTAGQRSDGRWDASSAAYEIASPRTVQYIGGTDDHAEGLDELELRPYVFDCFGLWL